MIPPRICRSHVSMPFVFKFHGHWDVAAVCHIIFGRTLPKMELGSHMHCFSTGQIVITKARLPFLWCLFFTMSFYHYLGG